MKVRPRNILWVLSLLIFMASGGFAIQQSLGQVRSETPKAVSLWGGVVPHYTAVMGEIERFWREMAANHPNARTIIVVGPDHRDIGLGRLTTTNHPEVLNGKVRLAKEIIDQMSHRGVVTIDHRVFVDEHSIQLHIPLIEREFPNAAVFPLLLRSGVEVNDVMRLVDSLRPLIADEAIVVASVDFSHYKSIEQARIYDEESLDAIRQFDFLRLSGFGPEHMDSDQSIILLSELVCPLRNCAWDVKFRQNSAEIAYQNPFFTTSVMSLILKSITY